MYTPLTALDRATIYANANDIAQSAPDDLDTTEVLTAMVAASLVAAKLGIPHEEILHAANAGFPTLQAA